MSGPNLICVEFSNLELESGAQLPAIEDKKLVSRQRLSQIEFAAKNHKSLELRVIDTGRHPFRQRMP